MMPSTTAILTLDTLTALRAAPVAEGQLVLVLGVSSYGDGLGGFYRWVSTASAPEDTIYNNIVISSISPDSGRWMRVFQRVRTVGPNTLISNGSFKTLFCPASTDLNGRVTIYLTDDGTATGNALFSTVMQTSGEGTAPVTDPNNMLIGSRYSMSADLKTLVYQFARGNSATLSALGANILGMRAAAISSSVSVRVDGV
jgi:hypothetical protein